MAIPPRADPRDALVTRSGATLFELPPGCRVGTSSLRRVCQLRAARPDLAVELLRGNVDTRLRKVAEGQVDAAILACAGLDRLGLAARITERLSIELMLPAIGQGALALEARRRRPATRPARAAATAALEHRGALPPAGRPGGRDGGGCRAGAAGGAGRRVPHAGRRPRHARGRKSWWCAGWSGAPTPARCSSSRCPAAPETAAELGAALAARLIARGADRILAELE